MERRRWNRVQRTAPVPIFRAPRPAAFPVRRFLSLCLLLATARCAGAAAAPPVDHVLYTAPTDPWFVWRASVVRVRAGGELKITLAGEAGTLLELRLGPNRTSVLRSAAGKAATIQNFPLGLNAAPAKSTELLLVRHSGTLRLAIDGAIAIEIKQLGQPSASLAVSEGAATFKLAVEPRYQPAEPIYLTDDFMTTPEAPSHWDAHGGRWQIAGNQRPQDAADPFKLVGRSDGSGQPGLSVNSDSRWFWDDYQAGAAIKLTARDSVAGVVFGYRDPEDYFYLAWDGRGGEGRSGAGQLILGQRRHGRNLQLASRAAAVKVGQWYRLTASRSNPAR